MLLLLKTLTSKLILNKYFGIFVLSLGLLFGLWTFHKIKVHEEVSKVRTELTQNYESKLKAEQLKAKESESKLLQDSIDQMAKKDEKIKNLNRELDSILTSLQYRTSRSDNSKSTKTAGTCTGAELYREDSEFLAREASRADRILEERNFYYNQYEAARKELETLQKGQNK